MRWLPDRQLVMQRPGRWPWGLPEIHLRFIRFTEDRITAEALDHRRFRLRP